MSLRTSIDPPSPSLNDKIGKVVFSSMISCIVLYHGLDSACKLYKMGAEAGEKISNFFNKKKEAKDVMKAATIVERNTDTDDKNEQKEQAIKLAKELKDKGRSNAEIAKEMGIPENSVRALLK